MKASASGSRSSETAVPAPAGRCPAIEAVKLKALRCVLLLAALSLVSSLHGAPGDLKWEFTSNGAVSSSPAIGPDGTLYFGSGWPDNSLYARDGATGAKRWAFAAGADVLSSPAIGADGTVYIGSNDKNVYALDGKTGVKRWAFNTGAEVNSSPAVGADGTVYVGSGNKVHALDGASGVQRWAFAAGGAVASSPAIGADGTVYVGSVGSANRVYALNGATGAKRWEFTTLGGVWSSPAVGADGTVYVGSLGPDNRVYALDGASGAKRWAFTAGGGIASSPAIGADGTVYVGCDDQTIYALDGATGAKRWAFTAGGGIASSPAIGADGVLYVGCYDRKIYALDGGTGAKQWEFTTGSAVKSSSPTVGVDGTVYIGSNGGTVYALASSSVGGLAETPWPKFRGNARNTGLVQTPAVNTQPPTISVQPQNLTNAVGSTATLTVGALGSRPLDYQWLKDAGPLTEGGRIAGTHSPTLVITNVQTSDAGLYAVVVTNSWGSATSQVARVTVGYTLDLTTVGTGSLVANPVATVYEPGTTVELTATPVEGRTFLGWQGDAAGLANPVRLTMDAHKGVVARFSLQPGDKKWEFMTSGGAMVFCPALGTDGTVYVGATNSVYALDGATGARKWVFEPKEAVNSSPAIGADGTVYVGASSNVYGLDGATGAKKWAFQRMGGGGSSPAIAANGTVYALGGYDSVYALDGATGARKWAFGPGGPVSSSPAIGADGTVYVGDSSNVYALDGVTGAEKWEFQVTGGTLSSPAIGADGMVYIGIFFWASGGGVYALEEASGTEKWAFPTGGGVADSPAIGSDGTVFVGSVDGKVYALDGATGAKEWEFKTGGQVRSAPALGADGTLYVGSTDGKLYALESATGAKKWAFTTGGWVSSPTIGSDGTVYVGSWDGKVHAIESGSVGGLADSPWPKFKADVRNTGLVQTTPVNPQPPTISGQPQNLTNVVGSTATLVVEASGSRPLSYQWHKDADALAEGGRVAGSRSAKLIITNVQMSDAGSYAVVVSNAFGSATSVPRILTVIPNGPSGTNLVLVPGTSNPWLAGMPDGSTSVGEPCDSADTAPAQSPALYLPVVAGRVLSFNVIGSVNNYASPPSATPDGQGGATHGSENGIAALDAPLNSLVGVFLSASQPSLTSAPSPGYYDPNGRTFMPGLKEVFFIGDGRTSRGVVQEFTVPSGATRLFLGTMDGCEWSNNTGSFNVEAVSPPTEPSGPEEYTFITLAGRAGELGSADGTGSAARFNGSHGVTVDHVGNIYVADEFNQTIRKISPAGVVTTLAGLAGVSGSADGSGSTARFAYPQDVSVDRAGNVYVADRDNHAIRKVTPAGEVTTLAGLAGSGGLADGTGSQARFNRPHGVAADDAGNVYVADSANHAIRKIGPGGEVTTLATMVWPADVAVDRAGYVFVADAEDKTVLQIAPGGVVTTVAGLSGQAGSVDGTGSGARFVEPWSVAVDSTGNLYVADHSISVIRKIRASGVVTTIAGLPAQTGSLDGTGSAARFSYPRGLAVDGGGNVVVADTGNNTIRVGYRKSNEGTIAIVQQPESQSVIIGADVALRVVASGLAPLSFSWVKDLTNEVGTGTMTGSTNLTIQTSLLVLTNVQISDAGLYAVVVTNTLGSVTSQVARVVVGYTLDLTTVGPGTLVVKPVATVYEPGTTVELTATPAAGRTFSGWHGDATGLANPLRLTMDAHKRVVAEFSLQPGESYPATIMADSPVAFWRLGEATGNVALDYVGGFNGTYLDGITLGRPGALKDDPSTAVGFNGVDGKVEVPYAVAFNSTRYTVECWAKLTGGAGLHRSPLTSRGDSPQRGFIFYATPSNRWEFWTGKGDQTGWDVIAGPAAVYNQWVYLAATYDGTTKRFYVNGQEVGTSLLAYAPNSDKPLRIGAGATEYPVANYFFAGDVDEVAVYGKALMPEQILVHYAVGAKLSSAPTIPTNLLVVPGTSDLWLATSPDGTVASVSPWTGAWDRAPEQSPIGVSGVVGGQTYGFDASGLVKNDPTFELYGPEGSVMTEFVNHWSGFQNGIGDLWAPMNSLVGVFLGSQSPTNSQTPPPVLDFRYTGLNFTTLSPALAQPFFIGDGWTTNRVQQQFLAPAGAVRLFLGTMDVCEWANNGGSFTVELATLAGKPVITSQPQSQDVLVGTNVTFQVEAEGTPPMSYQWQKDATNLAEGGRVAGTLSPTLVLTNVQTSDAGSYAVVVTNSWGGATSQVARMVVGYTLDLTTVGIGSLAANPAATVYEPGTVVDVTATPAEGRTFLGWHGDAAGLANPLRLTMDAHKRVVGEFSLLAGDKKWEFTSGGAVSSCPAIGADGTLYIGSDDNNVYALDGATGAKRWIFTTGGHVYAAAAVGADGTVYVGSRDSNVYALDGATGAKLWAFDTGAEVLSSVAVGEDGTVYLGPTGPGRTAYALNGATGTKKWEFIVGGGGLVWSSPSIGADGTVYFGNGTNEVYALDGETGAQRWVFTTRGPVWSLAIGTDGTVYIGSSNGKVYALAGSSVGGLANSLWPKFKADAGNTGRLMGAPRFGRSFYPRVWLEGSGQVVRAAVTGVPTPNLQWCFNGQPISGATSATLSIASVKASDDGVYTMIASNALGQVTSQPIRVFVSNIEPDRYLGLGLAASAGTTSQIEYRPGLETGSGWSVLTNLVLPDSPYVFIDFDSANATPRFYRATGVNRLGVGLYNAWEWNEPVGTRDQVDYIDVGSRSSDWQVLTNLTLTTSPYLFIDYEATNALQRFYRVK